MGDLSELRGMISVIGFVGILVLLMALIPSQFLLADYEGRTVNPEGYFDAVTLEGWNQSQLHYLNDSGAGYHVLLPLDIGGHDCSLWYVEPNASETHTLRMVHKTAEWIIIPTSHNMEWYRNGILKTTPPYHELSIETMEADYLDGSLGYMIKCDHFSASVFLGFNIYLYSSVLEAWDMGDLQMLIGISLDQVSTSLNAWDLIGMLLFFQLPDIHWIINGIIAIPLWICISYIAFILILRVIGAVFGGGGA